MYRHGFKFTADSVRRQKTEEKAYLLHCELHAVSLEVLGAHATAAAIRKISATMYAPKVYAP